MRGIKSEDHPMFGKTHTDEAKEKISMARTGKSYEEIFGEEEAKIQRQKRRDKIKEFISIKIAARTVLAAFLIELITLSYGMPCE